MESLNKVLRFGTKEHDRVRDAIRHRYDISVLKLTNSFKRWREAEDLFTFYLKESEADLKRRLEREMRGKQTYTTLVVPYSYAILMTAHTYWASVFLSRNPINQYTARHGETHDQVQAIEALIDYQVQVGEMIIPLFHWLMDMGKYGLGIIGNYWGEDVCMYSRIEQVPVVSDGGLPIPGKFEEKLISERVEGYTGNRIFNVRPYDFLPDPRVSVNNLQRGEFCGRQVWLTWTEISKRASNGEYFNIDALRKATPIENTREQGSVKIDLPEIETTDAAWGRPTPESRRSMDVHHAVEMVVELSPKEWGLGESSYPEKWAITLGNREVVMGCRPLGARHGRFPFFVMAYEPDPYSHSARGVMEITKPLNEVLTWLFNSRMYNVRQTLNGQSIVDQSRINVRDLLEGGPGKVIRVLPAAFGTDVRTAVSPLPIIDITRGHLNDAQFVMELLQRVSGATDNLMGTVHPGGRKTATEIRTSGAASINRLKVVAEYNSALGFAPLAQVMLQNTQQHYDRPQKFRIAGDLLTPNTKFLEVKPEEITGFYDFVPVDGTLPVDRFAQATLWKELLGIMAGIPQIAMSYDIAGIFSWMAQLAGLKNINRFKIQPAPDQAVLSALGAGDLVKANGTNGQGRGTVGVSLRPEETVGTTPGQPGLE